jgi:subtilisin-like proprotein convertase family protein
MDIVMSEINNIAATSASITPTAQYYNDTRENKQWYLDGSTLSPLSIDVYSVWKDYVGTGVKIGVIDSQIDYTHPDLDGSYDKSLDYNFALNTANPIIDSTELPLFHGTAVAGIIAAEANNGFGVAGIASGASLAGFGIDYNSDAVVDQIIAALNKSAGLDVVNNSWSFVSNLGDDFNKNPAYESALVHAVSQGRGGLGTSVVFAAGNAGTSGTSNYHNFQNSPYTIAVGAVDPNGSPSSFTSLGANVLISAAGRDVYTTDLKGRFDTLNGTSFAAPAVSAAVGLMLEANPELGYRDVQEILAYSARRAGLADSANFGDGWRTNGADNFNGGGLHFNDAFGYGFLNVHDAVRLAETWSKQQTYANLATVSETVDVNRQLIAGSNDHISVSIAVDEALDVEHVQLSMDLRWLDTGDLDVYLTSPDGTQVRLVYDLPYADRIGNIRDFTFDSVASMGEQAAGTWTLDVYNRNPAAKDKGGAPLSGELQDVTLTLSGSAQNLKDDLYIYTDEFGMLYTSKDLAERSVLRDTDGGTDTLNAAAVTSNTVIDLSAAKQTVIAGVTLSLQANVIENAYTGDGKDTLIGSDLSNILKAGRGDDVIYFSFGNDVLDGGQGKDTLILGCGFGSLSGYVTSGGDLAISVRAGEVSTVCDVETFVFSDRTLAYADLAKLFGAKSDIPLPVPAPEEPAKDDDAGNSTPDDTAGGSNGSSSGAAGGFDEAGRAYDKSFAGTSAGEKIRGSNAADKIDGAGGNDILIGRGGNDALYGGLGDDKLNGGSGSDYLDGGKDSDKLYGDLGSDKLYGDAGDDLLKGGDGDDWIDGGSGSDRLYGEAGADTFVFDIADLDGLDTIYDFNAAEGDRILVKGLGANSSASFEFVTSGTNTYLEMHDDDGVTQIARIKGAGLDDLGMTSSDLGLIWA